MGPEQSRSTKFRPIPLHHRKQYWPILSDKERQRESEKQRVCVRERERDRKKARKKERKK